MIVFLIFGLFFSQDLGLPGFPKYDDIVVEIRNKFGKELVSKYKYEIVGSGGGIEKGIYCTGWHIVAKRKVNLKQARKEYLGIIEELLKRINNDERMKAHLKDKPLDYHNIDLIIGYEDPKWCRDSPEKTNLTKIGVVCKKNNIISYGINDEKESCGFSEFHRETYEEALQIFLAEKSSQAKSK